MPEPIVTDEDGTKDQEHETQPIKSQHELDMDALVARRQSEIKDQADEVTEPDHKKDEPIEPEDESKEKGDAQPPMVSLYDDEGNAIEIPATAKFKAKIDGQEVEVPFEQMSRSYQVGAAADNKMREASLKIKEIEQREKDLEAKGQELSKAEQSYKDQMDKLEADKASGEVSETDYQETAQKLLNALTDAENPTEALVDVLKDLSPQAPTVDQDKIIAAAEERAEQKAKATFEEKEKERAAEKKRKEQEALDAKMADANAKFEADHKDIIDDPVLYRLTKSYANENMNVKKMDPQESIKDAVKRVKEWQKENVKAKRPTPPVTPKSVSSRASIGKDEKPETRKDILSKMRQSRGQPA